MNGKWRVMWDQDVVVVAATECKGESIYQR